jgi:hypothetical protein
MVYVPPLAKALRMGHPSVWGGLRRTGNGNGLRFELLCFPNHRAIRRPQDGAPERWWWVEECGRLLAEERGGDEGAGSEVSEDDGQGE